MSAENVLSMIKTMPKQIEEAIALASELKISGEFDKIIVAGMGGSGLPGNFLRAYMYDSRVPVIPIKDYTLPGYVNSRTLIFAISYSGNTEETIELWKQAHAKNAKVVSIAAGGKIADMCEKEHKPLIRIPDGFQPRLALGYQFFTLLPVLHKLKLIKDYSDEVKTTIKSLKGDQFEKSAEDLAGKFVGKVPVIYTTEKLAASGYFWKIALNENAKTLAIQNVFSELNHNEMSGFIHPNAKHFVLIMQDEQDHKRNVQRMKITKDLIAGLKTDVMHMVIKGPYPLTRMFSSVYLAALTSCKLAEKLGIDPELVEMQEDIKKKLGPMKY